MGAVLVRGEGTRPAVEDLHRLGSGLDLGAQARERQVGEAVEQLPPQRGVAVHETLRADVVP